MENVEWLHIHGAALWHDESFIVGNRAGLEALRDAINAALAHEHSGTAKASAFTGDGEGFDFYISLASDDPATWKCPYNDECAWDRRQDAIDPLDRAMTDLATQQA